MFKLSKIAGGTEKESGFTTAMNEKVHTSHNKK